MYRHDFHGIHGSGFPKRWAMNQALYELMSCPVTPKVCSVHFHFSEKMPEIRKPQFLKSFGVPD